jgi:cytochrome c
VPAADSFARCARSSDSGRRLTAQSRLHRWQAYLFSGTMAAGFQVFSTKLTGGCMTRHSLSHVIFFIAALFVAQAAHAALDKTSADAMMKKSGCAACHAIDKKLIGPPYQDVAAKYQGDMDALAKLSDKVKKGGVGVWGQVPMPPNAQIPDADIKDLVSWILTLKK